MPHVTLLSPLTLTYKGVNYKKGVRTPVSPELARELESHPRFKVSLRDLVDRPAEPLPPIAEKPPPTSLEAVVAAMNGLDAEDENYDPDGKPALAVLSRILGRGVTAEEREKAIALAQRRGLDGPTMPKPSRTRIIRRRAEKLAESPEAVVAV